jgi:hypothetical protein
MLLVPAYVICVGNDVGIVVGSIGFAGFQEENLSRRIFRQATGEHGSRGTASYDDDIKNVTVSDVQLHIIFFVKLGVHEITSVSESL